jgi:hypothetical protein
MLVFMDYYVAAKLAVFYGTGKKEKVICPSAFAKRQMTFVDYRSK